jgi:hypothetical protein
VVGRDLLPKSIECIRTSALIHISDCRYLAICWAKSE